MTEEQLISYFPKIGDRIFVSDYCKTRFTTTKKDSLLEKLREKIARSNNSKAEEKVVSNATKKEKQIELGWFCGDRNQIRQVRTKNGGGTRKVLVDKNFKKQEIMELAKKLFFPDGKSSMGQLEEFDFDLLNFNRSEFSSGLTVNDYYKITGLSRVRFYLSSVYKDCKNDKDNFKMDFVGASNCFLIDNQSNMCHQCPDAVNLQHNKNVIENEYMLEDTFNVEVAGPSKEDISNIDVADSSNFPSLVSSQSNMNHQQPELLNLQSERTAHENEDILDYSQYSHIEIITDDRKYSCTKIIQLHRGQVFQELITHFLNLEDLSVQFQIEMILPSGEKELGADFGGIYRDALSEFWETFYQISTEGTTFKIPVLRHDFAEFKWVAIGKILYKGYIDENYFPLKLAPGFIECCILDKCVSDLTAQFLKYISNSDKETLITALEDWKNVDISDLEIVLDLFECKWYPTEANIKTMIKDTSHKYIVQKPKFIIDCWHKVLRNIMTYDEICNIYETCVPHAKNVISKLNLHKEMSLRETEVVKFLKKYIKDCDTKTLESLVRFCTGSDILTNQGINITFNGTSGIARAAIGHTCSFTLELPVTYDTFQDFRSEMNSMLRSNMLIMDLV